MAGRGRGRGRRMMTFSVEAVGINRGDSLPPSIQQPTPLFPVMEQKPLPLAGGEEAEYLLALKQEFRGAMKSLPCFIQPAAAHRDVERYSDKYHSSEPTDGTTDWTPDWKRFPKELRVHVKNPAIIDDADRMTKMKRVIKALSEWRSQPTSTPLASAYVKLFGQEIAFANADKVWIDQAIALITGPSAQALGNNAVKALLSGFLPLS
ncbi:DNA-directed RNA polymerase III subunit RPC7-like [Micropterus dolomieu]|uniref:DNA-directed RNA polymerase III subunit RPC7-like n=1 Tax=Micropterus dolomieu TaxID=147949 RepID=UPI001E8CAC93|nr:DNA-directed RNA polymerase III subunit RPC7-like [Micropterus dolomieu]XP_045897868.1 DNA-directed RNA polymerase III subunit RPC7-like [Micropterus dolomieu]